MIFFINITNLDIRTKSDFKIEKNVKDVFEIESNYIRCTIPFQQEVIDQIDNKNDGLNVGLNKTEKKVIEILME